ncbi:hypothetical protein [Aquimarina macrocephali]|uniref:hypothetical protein n=1 Tax=Aquimarina macrocephali TaxID=666563 RepID=UPI003F674543
MAVEVQKIKDRIKALFPNVNLSQARIDEVSDRLAKLPSDDADEAAIDAVVNSANAFMPFDGIAKEDDRVRNLEAKTKKNVDPVPKPTPSQAPVTPPNPNTDNQNVNEDTPAWVKALLDSNKVLTEKVTDLEKGKVIENKLQQATKVFENSKVLKAIKKEEIKETWMKRIDLESETSFEDQVKGLEEEYNDLVQTHNDSKDFAGTPPNGFSSDEATDQEIDDIVI